MKNFYPSICALLLLLIMVSEVKAQLFVQVGTGTEVPANTLYSPIYRFSATSATRYVQSNTLFTATDLTTAGLPAGAIIDSVAYFKVNSAASAPAGFFYQMYVGNSTQTDPLPQQTFNDVTSTKALVISDSAFQLTSQTGWYTFPFSSPVVYTGDGLEIATFLDYGSPAANVIDDNVLWQFTTGNTTTITALLTAVFTNNMTASVAGYRHRPNIRIYYRLPTGLDAQMSALISPSTFGLGANQVTTRLQNAGADSIFSADIGYQLDNNTPVIDAGVLINPALNSGDTYDHTFTTPLNLTQSGSYTLKTWLANVNGLGPDNNVSNDTLITSFCTALSGNISVGTVTSDYETLTDAIDAVMSCGISAPVTLLLAPGTYDGNFSIGSFLGASFGLTITSATSNPTDVVISNGGSGNTFTIENSENVTLSSLTISNPTAPTAATACVFVTASSNISIVSSIISANSTSSSINNRAIYATNTQGLTVISNQISDAYYGIYHVGATSPNYSLANQYVANNITNCYYYGIYLTNHALSQVEANRITDFQTNASAQGIYLGRSQDMTVGNNEIYGSIGIYGIYMTNVNASATPGGRNLIYNNVISGDFSSTTPRAIYFLASTTDGQDQATIVHNSIEMRVSSTATTANGAVFFTGGSATNPLFTNLEFFNNSIKVIRQTSGTNMANLYMPGDYIMDSLRSDNNLFFFDGTNPAGEVRIGTTNYNLADWTTFSGQDSNSVVGDPLYTSITDLAPLSVSPLKDAARPLSYVTNDIAGTARGSNPDIGAYEILVSNDDILMVDFVSPIATSPGGTPLTVSARFMNVGTNALTSASFSYQFDNEPVVTEAFTGSIAAQDTGVFTFTSTLTIPIGASGILRVWSAAPNGQVDPTPSNDTISQLMCQPLNGGTYTVGSPTSDFPDFSLLGEVLDCGGINGPVVFLLEAPGNLFQSQLSFGMVNGASAVNTITIDGQGDTLSSAGVAGSAHVIVLNGSKHVRLRNMVIRAEGNTSGILLQDAEDIQIVNNVILIDLSVTATSTAGILGSGSLTTATAATPLKNIVIDSNIIEGGYYGIRVNGAAANKIENISITNNIMRDFHFYGVYNLQSENLLIERNELSRPTRTATTTFYGIYSGAGARGMKVSKNRIHTTNGPSPSSTSYASYGVFYTGAAADSAAPNVVSNNLIYNFNSISGSIYGIYVTGGSGVKVYHNTLVFDDSSATSGLLYANYFLGTGSAHEFKNNITYVSRTGTGNKYCLYITGANNVPESDRNVFVMASTGGTTNNVGYFTTAFNTLTDWQTANNGAFDQNSSDADPLFTDAANFDFKPSNFPVNDIGFDLTSLVPTDIFDTLRSNTPDPGAIEFTVVGCLGVQNVSVDSLSYDAAEIFWLSAANNWQLEYGPAGFTLGTGTRVTTSTRPYLISGLQPNTAYQVFVRDTCTGSVSAWSDSIVFETLRDYDLGLTALLSPEDELCADSITPLMVVVSNNGVLPVNGYSISAIASGATSATLNANSTNVVGVGETDTLVVGVLNLSAGGTLSLQVVVDGTLDVYTDNDSLNVMLNIIPVNTPIIQTLSDSICVGQSLTLWVDSSLSTETMTWLDSANTVIGMGDSLTIPSLTTTTTFFAQRAAAIRGKVGPVDTTFGSAGTFAAASLNAQSNLITAFNPVKLKRAKVYVQQSGWLVVMLRDLSGVEVARDSVNVVQTGAAYAPVYVDIDLEIPAGSWRLGALASQSAGGMLRNNGGAAFPYEIPGVFSITGSTFNAVSYYYFYDMELEYAGCPTPISSFTVFAKDLTTAAFTMDTTALPTILFDASTSSNATNYSWDFGDGTSDTAMITSHTYTSNGDFTVTLVTEGDCGPDTATSVVSIMGVSVRDLQHQANLKLYPNPNNGNFMLIYEDEQLLRADLRIQDAMGRVVYKTEIRPTSSHVEVDLQLERLAEGMYHVHVVNDQGHLVRKFNVIK